MKLGTITAKGQTTVPKDVRDKLGLKPGDKVTWAVEDGRAVLRPKNKAIKDLAGVFYDPDRKPVTIEDMNDAVANAAAESGMAGLKRSHDRS